MKKIELNYNDPNAIEWILDHLPHVRPYGFEKAKAITIEKEKHKIAGVIYSNFQGYDIEMSMASITPLWANRHILKALFHYPFHQLGCVRVTATTPKYYRHVRRFLERLGFKLEGIIRRGYGAEDACIYCLLREECKFLN